MFGRIQFWQLMATFALITGVNLQFQLILKSATNQHVLFGIASLGGGVGLILYGIAAISLAVCGVAIGAIYWKVSLIAYLALAVSSLIFQVANPEMPFLYAAMLAFIGSILMAQMTTSSIQRESYHHSRRGGSFGYGIAFSCVSLDSF
jgi:hypothetical protein